MRTALLSSCTVLLWAAPAVAAPEPSAARLAMRFAYTRGPGAESCPREHTAHDMLMGELGYDPIAPLAGPLLQIDVTRRGPEFHVALTIEGDDGTVHWVQEMDDRGRCIDLIRSAVLAACVMAEDIFLPSPRPAPQPPAAPPPEPVLAPVPPPRAPTPKAAPPLSPRVPARKAAPPARWSLQIGAGPALAWGLPPGLGAGGHGFVTGRFAFLSLSVEIRALGSVLSLDEGNLPTGGLFLSASALPCVHHGPFFLCSALGLGRLSQSVGRTSYLHEVPPSTLLSLGGRTGFEWPFNQRFALRSFVELSGVLTRARIVRDNREAWDAPSVFVGVGLAFSVHL